MLPYKTLAEAMANIGRDVPERGFVFQDIRGEETYYSFPQLDERSAQCAAALQALGVNKGDRVGIVVIDPEQFVPLFLGTLRVGILPIPLYPPISFNNLDEYMDRTSRILESSGTKCLVGSENLLFLLAGLQQATPSVTQVVAVETLRDNAKGAPDYPEIHPDDVAFLQYTSGSTADPRGVVVTHGNLVHNCRDIIHHGLQLDPEVDVGVAWLPLYHDMGLIGFVMSTILNGIQTVFIHTLRFLSQPSSWMETIHRHRGTTTFGPNFAYALATRRAKPEELEEWDLSCLTCCGCGAEPIQPETMRAFTELFHERCNMPLTAVTPAYGMAEATLAITLKPRGQLWSTTILDRKQFEAEGTIRPIPAGPDSVEHVSCGELFPGHEMVALDREGRPLPEGVEGELCLSGPSVTQGYYRDPEATARTWHNGRLHTGDLGYVIDRQVYVTGRSKDLIILNGRNIPPQSVEWIVGRIDGVRTGSVVAFSRPGSDSEELVIALETRSDDVPFDRLSREVRTTVARAMSVTVAGVECLAKGTLPKTSSGKLQRGKTRLQYLEGRLGSGGSRAPAHG